MAVAVGRRRGLRSPSVVVSRRRSLLVVVGRRRSSSSVVVSCRPSSVVVVRRRSSSFVVVRRRSSSVGLAVQPYTSSPQPSMGCDVFPIQPRCDNMRGCAIRCKCELATRYIIRPCAMHLVRFNARRLCGDAVRSKRFGARRCEGNTNALRLEAESGMRMRMRMLAVMQCNMLCNAIRCEWECRLMRNASRPMQCNATCLSWFF